jgi:hypothetical protein
MTTNAHQRDKKVMSSRDIVIVGAIVVLVAVALAWWRAANGAEAATAVLAGFSVIFIASVGLTANQLAARRRSRRRASS